ncbi:uncharacterized protein BYT42DRAFT_555239 [Radiomyces spectabilis]|uniref:uncharacterized protein n=1 Tax=Radiomyces spectabilis TaxID=64574 RepID=UPI00221EFDBD|nr:uncharacterized protein BYT42DRAFT_555239 [Radiomyces spectabilis]KAI8391006.1 hypothetical protein BYT42DRAFT_555239 [Radiomyces spectabilis]
MPREPLEKPIDEVLSGYRKLDVHALQENHKLELPLAMPWRMNLCATSQEYACTFFVAVNDTVNVYFVDNDGAQFNRPVHKLVNPNAYQAGQESPFMINAILVDRLLDKEVLITVADNGDVCVWRTEALDQQPMMLRAEASTWGVAVHTEQGLLAVSANDKKITIFNILRLTQSSRLFEHTSPCEPRRRTKNWLRDDDKIVLEGHEHNIPNVDFSRSGRYLASCSVDKTCRVWDIAKRTMVTKRTIYSSQSDNGWGWSVKFIPSGRFKYACMDDKRINQMIQKRLDRGSTIRQSSVGLRHSAPLPVYRFNQLNFNEGERSEATVELNRMIFGFDPGDWDPELFQGEMEDGATDDDLSFDFATQQELAYIASPTSDSDDSLNEAQVMQQLERMEDEDEAEDAHLVEEMGRRATESDFLEEMQRSIQSSERYRNLEELASQGHPTEGSRRDSTGTSHSRDPTRDTETAVSEWDAPIGSGSRSHRHGSDQSMDDENDGQHNEETPVVDSGEQLIHTVPGNGSGSGDADNGTVTDPWLEPTNEDHGSLFLLLQATLARHRRDHPRFQNVALANSHWDRGEDVTLDMMETMEPSLDPRLSDGEDEDEDEDAKELDDVSHGSRIPEVVHSDEDKAATDPGKRSKQFIEEYLMLATVSDLYMLKIDKPSMTTLKNGFPSWNCSLWPVRKAPWH